MSMEYVQNEAGTRFLRYHRQLNIEGVAHAVDIDVARADGEPVVHKDHTYGAVAWHVTVSATRNVHGESWKLLFAQRLGFTLASADEVARMAESYIRFDQARF